MDINSSFFSFLDLVHNKKIMIARVQHAKHNVLPS